MKLANEKSQFEIPVGLHEKLQQFRRRLWHVKSLEAVFVVLSVLSLSYLALFVSDRLGETPETIRLGLFLIGLSSVSVFLPWKLYRWVWRHRELTDLARLLSRDQPRTGDRLLGVIELVQNTGDRHASPSLCQAAIQQVAKDTRDIDFQAAVTNQPYLFWQRIAALCAGIAFLALIIPAAGTNAVARWVRPLADIPRYTFAQLSELPRRLVVPVGEPFEFSVSLTDSTVWSPSKSVARLGDQARIASTNVDGSYTFDVPAQTVTGDLALAVGDARHRIQIQPKSRPELTALAAQIKLPEYLGYPQQVRDVRSGSVSIVRGSRARFTATASRELADAKLNGKADGIDLVGSRITSPVTPVYQDGKQEFQWTDIDGLPACSPFQLRVRCIEDRPPSLQCSDLPAESVVLEEDTLSFEISANDDFGIKTIGLEWAGIEDSERNLNPDRGESLVVAGNQQKASLTAHGAFSPAALGISPQPIHVRMYAEDYLPGRERAYSPVYRLYVLDREQHMIWMTEQLQQWERQVLEVRDQEQRLLETNEMLQQLSLTELAEEPNRQHVARQAAAERANAKRLSGLTSSGERLVTQAARNSEFNVATLEEWAQMLVSLKQFAASDMPSVANLLGQAVNAQPSIAGKPMAPTISDVETEARRDPPHSEVQNKDAGPSSQGGNALGLPTSTVLGKSASSDNESRPAGQKMEQVVQEQQKLLTEFNRVMDKMAKLLRDLQGSTFVKRLKSAARSELGLAADLHKRLSTSFGVDQSSLSQVNQALLHELYQKQTDTAADVRLIQEDLLAYFERTLRTNYRVVHDEMKETKVVSNFKRMSAALALNYTGETIAQAEYWSDQLDRWAEILVGPG